MIEQKGMTWNHDFGYSFPLLPSLLNEEKKEEWKAKIVIFSYAFLLDHKKNHRAEHWYFIQIKLINFINKSILQLSVHVFPVLNKGTGSLILPIYLYIYCRVIIIWTNRCILSYHHWLIIWIYIQGGPKKVDYVI